MQAPALISPDYTVLAHCNRQGHCRLHRVCKTLRQGAKWSGGVVPRVDTYCSPDNCETAITTVRDPYFETAKNYTGKDANSWAGLVKF